MKCIISISLYPIPTIVNKHMNDIENKILKIYDCCKDKSKVSRILLKNENSDCLEFLNSRYPMLSDSKYSIGMKLYWFINGYSDFPKCIECGKPNKTHRCYSNGYATQFCSRKCAHGKNTIEKTERTNVSRYGVPNASQSESAKKNRILTNNERYGCDNVFQCDTVKEKSKNTKICRYGDEKYTNMERRKKTNNDRYGCDNPFGNMEVRKKIENTMIERYGVSNPMECQSIRDKSSEKSKSYAIHNSYENYLVANPYSKPNFTEDFYSLKGGRRFEFEFTCRKCGGNFKSRIHNGTIRRCPKCYPSVTTSAKEMELFDFITSFYDGPCERKNRTVLDGQELDMLFSEMGMAIEFDGLYWHSELNGIGSRYHVGKTEACEMKGIRLIHVFEDEWDKKQNIVKHRIMNMFGKYDRTVFARKCVIGRVGKEEGMEFLDKNHMQGYTRHSVGLGLYLDGELVSMMTFCKPRIALGMSAKANEWELLRFCNKMGYHVPGAASRLLRHFEIEFSPSKITTYADRRWSDGNLYKVLGFSFSHNSKPNYWYLNNGCSERFHRFSFRKSVLRGKLKKFDETKTEIENMIENKYTRIFDCGNMVFVKSYP